MKKQMLALFLIFIMVASAFGAIDLTATKISAQTGTTLTLSSTNYAPTSGQQYTLSGSLRDSTGPLANKPIDIFYRLSDGVWHFSNTIYTHADGTYSTTTSSSQKVDLQTGYKVGSSYLASSNVVTINVGTPTMTPSIYYVPQAGSTWANQGTAGASYGAYVSTPSLFQTKANGAYWGDIGQNDFICIPAGSATNNQNVASWEIGFHFSGITSDASATSAHRYQKIWDKADGGFSIYIDTEYGLTYGNNYLTISRALAGGGARWYIPTVTPLHVGHNYYIQISWDTSAGPGKEPYPTVWIGEDGNAPVLQTRWDESGGALARTGSWYDDSVGSATLGVMSSGGACGSGASAKADWLIGGFYVYRQYNSIVDFSSGGSWSTDKLAWTT